MLASVLDMLALSFESHPFIPTPFFSVYFKDWRPSFGIFTDFMA
jgi:hypothetical protein